MPSNYSPADIDRFIKDSYLIGRVVYWKSNDDVPPADIVEAMAEVDPTISVEYSAMVRKSQTREAIENYKRARANRTPEQVAEEAFEVRAAFGPGVEVVDVLTGERVTS